MTSISPISSIHLALHISISFERMNLKKSGIGIFFKEHKIRFGVELNTSTLGFLPMEKKPKWDVCKTSF